MSKQLTYIKTSTHQTVRDFYHNGGGVQGRTQNTGTRKYNNNGSKRRSRGGKGSKDKRKKQRAGKQLEYLRAQEVRLRDRSREADRAVELTLAVLRDLENARKCEASNVRKHDVVDPPNLALPPPIRTTSLPEHTTVLRTQETMINNTIFDTLTTDEGLKSNILEEVFDESITFEDCNFQQVMYNENEEEEFAKLEQTCYSTYYRRNPDNNKTKFKRLGLQPIVNKYGFSQDNYYLTDFYNKQKELDDKYERDRLIEQKRNDATVRFEDNQTQARQNEREKPNPVINIIRQSNEQKQNRKRTNNAFVENEIRKKRRITDNC